MHDTVIKSTTEQPAKPKTLICVMAHKEAQETFDRHFNLWRSLDADMLVACPDNSKVTVPEKSKVMLLDIGRAQHIGMQSIIRIRTILEHLDGQKNYDRFVFFEYDSFCLGPLPDPRAMIMCPLFRDNAPDRGFTGTMFCHPPIMFTAAGLTKLVWEIKQMPMQWEQSVWDRWIGLAIERAGLFPIDMLASGEAYASNTIHPEQFPGLAKAVQGGAVFIHGCKTRECFDVIMKANKLRALAAEVKANGGEVKWDS